MKLVVDANIVFAALIKKGWTFDFIRLLSKKGFKLYSPVYILKETNDRIDRLAHFSGLNKTEIGFLMNILFRKIEVVPERRYNKFIKKAQELLPQHPKDVPYFALALSLDCAIWSNEKRLKQQSCITVVSTDELKSFI